MNKHEAFKVNILKVLSDLSHQIKPSHAKFIFDKIQKIEMKDLDKFVLTLVRALTKNMIKGPSLPPQETKQLRKQGPLLPLADALAGGSKDDTTLEKTKLTRTGSLDTTKPKLKRTSSNPDFGKSN